MAGYFDTFDAGGDSEAQSFASVVPVNQAEPVITSQMINAGADNGVTDNAFFVAEQMQYGTPNQLPVTSDPMQNTNTGNSPFAGIKQLLGSASTMIKDAGVIVGQVKGISKGAEGTFNAGVKQGEAQGTAGYQVTRFQEFAREPANKPIVIGMLALVAYLAMK